MYLNPLKVKVNGGQHPKLLFPRAPLTELVECLKEMPPLPSLGTTFCHGVNAGGSGGHFVWV
jgi:hypothetical protein